MTMKGVSEGMSVKDMLADILSREQFISDRLSEILHGEAYAPSVSQVAFDQFYEQNGYPDYESSLIRKDKPDHLVIYKHKNIALDEVISQELAAFSNIMTAFEKLTHEQCLNQDVYHRIAEHTYRPYRRVGTEIRGWLIRITSELK